MTQALLLVAMVLTTPPARVPPAYVVHVSPDGDDNAAGTEAAPLRTPAAARDRLRALRADGRPGDAEVVLAAGRYALSEPLVFGREDSFTQWVAAVRGTVELSGGVAVTGWRVGDDGRWRAAYGGDPPRQLYVNGRWATRARTPNLDADNWKVTGVTTKPQAGDAAAKGMHDALAVTLDQPELDADWPTTGHVELVVLRHWSAFRQAVTGFDADAGVVRLRTPAYTVPSAQAHGNHLVSAKHGHFAAYLEGHAAFADQPGEWGVDAAAGELVYVPLEEEAAEDIEAIVPVLDRLVVVEGEADAPVHGLRLIDLTFAHTRFDLHDAGLDGMQAGRAYGPDDGRNPVAAVGLRFARHVVLSRCTVEQAGGHGLWIGEGCREVEVLRSTIRDTGANAVMIGTHADRPADDPRHVSGTRVGWCDVTRAGRVMPGAVGVWQGLASESLIDHNHIHDLPYTGVSMGWRWNDAPTAARDNTVEGNHIHNVMQRLSDGGGIYTLGRQPGSVLKGNVIHGVKRGPHPAGAPNNGLYFDQGSSDITATGNTVFDTTATPVRFHGKGGMDVTVTDNTLVTSGRPGEDGLPGTQSPPYRDRIHYRQPTEDHGTGVAWRDNRIVTPAAWEAERGAAIEAIEASTGR